VTVPKVTVPKVTVPKVTVPNLDAEVSFLNDGALKLDQDNANLLNLKNEAVEAINKLMNIVQSRL
jgi:hypothetical protein